MTINWKLRTYLTNNSQSVGGDTTCISDPRSLGLYDIYLVETQCKIIYNSPTIKVTFANYAYIEFLHWVKTKATSEHCIRAGFSEHDVMELFG